MNKPHRAQSIADLVRPALADAFRAQGFAAADIVGRWPEIAGERLAAHSLPVRVVSPPRPKVAAPDSPPEPATLVLKVESAFAFEVQMMQAQILERVNAVFGWRCVGKIRLSQGPVIRPEPKRGRSAPQVGRAEALKLEKSLAAVTDPELRDSLARLGTAVVAEARARAAKA